MIEQDTPLNPKAPQHNRRGAFSLLFASLLAIGAGNTMLIAAVVPILTRQLEMPDWTAGAIFSLSAAVWTFCSPFWGRKSSEWGRRPVIAIGMLGYSASMGLLGLVALLALEGYIQGVALTLAGNVLVLRRRQHECALRRRARPVDPWPRRRRRP